MSKIVSFNDYKDKKHNAKLTEHLSDTTVDGFLEAQKVVNSIEVSYENKYERIYSFRELRAMGYLPSDIRRMIYYGDLTEETGNFKISYDILGEWGVNTTGKFKFHRYENVKVFLEFYSNVYVKYLDKISKVKSFRSMCFLLLFFDVFLMILGGLLI